MRTRPLPVPQELLKNIARNDLTIMWRPPHVKIIHQVDTATDPHVELVRENIRKSNPKTTILETACCVFVSRLNPSGDATCWRWKTVPRPLTVNLNQ